jgi:hypothetical protein
VLFPLSFPSFPPLFFCAFWVTLIPAPFPMVQWKQHVKMFGHNNLPIVDYLRDLWSCWQTFGSL